MRKEALLADLAAPAVRPGNELMVHASLRKFRSRGPPLTGLVGTAQSEWLEAADLVAFGARWMESSLAPPAKPQP
jgi:aminoglycoside N3'-acetyltransferase